MAKAGYLSSLRGLKEVDLAGRRRLIKKRVGRFKLVIKIEAQEL